MLWSVSDMGGLSSSIQILTILRSRITILFLHQGLLALQIILRTHGEGALCRGRFTLCPTAEKGQAIRRDCFHLELVPPITPYNCRSFIRASMQWYSWQQATKARYGRRYMQ